MSILRDAIKKNREDQELRAKTQTDSILKRAIQMNRAGEKVEPVRSAAAQKNELPGLSLPTLDTEETPLASDAAKEKAVLDMEANGTKTKFQGTVFEQTAANEAGKSALERQNVRGMTDQLKNVQTRYATDEQIDNRISAAREAVEDLQLQKQYAEAVGDLDKAAEIEARRKVLADRVGELASEKQTRADNAYYRDLESRQTGLETVRGAEDYLSAAESASYQNIPRGGEYENLRRAVMSLTTGKLADSKAQQMTEDEKNTLLYYVGKGQTDKAKEYLETLDRALNARQNKDAAENAAQWAKEHPVAAVLGSAVTWPANIPAFLENAGNTVQQAVTGKYEPADANSNIYLGARMNAGLQQGVSTAAKEWGTSTFGNETAGEVVGFLAGLLPDVMQNLAQALTLGPAALPAMALSAAGSTTTEALERGATKDQAFWLGTIGGATEYITEKLPLENILSVLKREGKVGLMQMILDVLMQGGTEFAEEAISEIAGIVADIIIMGQKSEFQQAVKKSIAEGMDETAARSKALVQYFGTNVLQAGLGGFLSGGMMMGATNAVNQGTQRVGKFIENNKIEKETEALKNKLRDAAYNKKITKTQDMEINEEIRKNKDILYKFNEMYDQTTQDERAPVQQTQTPVQEVSAEDTVRGVIDAALESGNGKTTTAAVSAALNNLGGNTDALTSAFRTVMNEREYVFDRDGNIVKRSPYDVHIDERTGEDLSSRRVNAFQFDHPELHRYFAEAAKAMQYDISGTVPGERFPTYGPDGYMVKYTGTTRYTTEPVATVKDDYGLSYGDIDRALQNIIEDNGQENYAAAKKVEMVLDDMLTNGYTDIDGNQIPANEEYVAAKERVLPESERNARAAQAAQAYQEESEGLPLFSGTEIRDGYAETLKGAQTDGRAEGDQGTVAAQPGGDGAAESGAGIGNPPYGGDGGRGAPVDTARQDGRMGAPEGTESRARNQQAVVARSRQDAVNARRVSKNRSVRLGVKEVRPVDLGVKQVSENAYVTEMPEDLVEQDEELRTIRDENREDGYETHFFIGRATNKSGKGFLGGWVDENKMEIWIQADNTNPESTATKLNLHERAHPILDEPGVSSYVARRLIEHYGKVRLREMIASYLERYRGVYNVKDAGTVDETTGFTAEEMESLKEFLADSLAGRNRFGARAGDLQQEVAAYMDERGVNAKSSAVAEAMDRRTGPPAGRTDIRFSEEETQEGGNSLRIDNETNRGYDGRTNTEQEGNYGREEEAAAGKGIPGNVLREEAQRPAYSDEGGAGGVRTEAARDRRVGEIAPWADGRLTEPKTKAAGEALEAAREYGARAYTVEDAAIKERRDTALALTQNGVIYLSDSIPDGMGEVIGNHELVHAEKQNGNEAYLDFLDGTFQRLDHQTQGAADLVDLLADMRVPGSSFMDLDEKQGETVLDELNALVWGYYKADPENAREQFSTVFLDYDSYIRDLEAAVTRNADTVFVEDDEENDAVRFSMEEDETPAAYQFRRVNTLEEEQAPGREKGEDDLYRPEGMGDRQYDILNRRWKEQQSRRTAQADPEARAAVEQEKYMQDLSKENFVGTEAMQKLGVKIEGSVGIYDAIKSMIANDRAAKSVRKETRKAERRLHATEAERNFAAGISAGIYTAEDIPASMDRDKVEELADYYWAERAVSSDMIAQQRTDINRRLSDKMGELFKDSENFKVSRMLVLNNRTPERNMLHIFGNERGAAINKAIFDPVSVNEAERFRFQNRMLDKVRAFEDSSGKKSQLTKEERALVQQVIEGKAVQEMVAGMEMSGAIESAAENIRNGKDAGDQAQEFGLNDEEKRLAVKYARWLETQEALKSGTVDNTRVENAVKTYSELFNQFYDAINDFLVAHGYEPIGFIKGYAPHLQPEQNINLLNKALQSMGINTDVTKLPASIAGLTANYKPNKRWNPYFLTRTSDVTKYDIAEAFESYLDYMSDVLYHTDDIMRVRQAANYFRRTYAPEEIRNDLEWAESLRDGTVEEKANFLRDHDLISKSTAMTPEDISRAMDEYVEEKYKNIQNTTKYSDLVMWLDNYANILAGKQSMADRGWEYSSGRTVLNIGNKLVRAFGKAQVAGNLSSALNQTAQIPQIFGELGVKRTAQAIADMMSGKTRRAGWAQESDFLTGKEGVNYIVTDAKDMVIGALFKPAEIMDNVTATLAVRGKYLQEIANGKTEKEAMKAADAFGKAVMGSRMKGSRPLGFEAKNPVSQMVHVFQVEAINSWEHISQDLPRDFQRIAQERGKGTAARALAGVIVKTLLAAFLLNRVAEEAYGGTPAPLDILGLSANFIASGEGLTTNQWLKTVLDNGWEKLTGERLFDTEADALGGDFDWSAAMEDTAYNISNDVPYLRNVAGLLGLGDNTLPIPNLYGAGKDIATAVMDDGLLSPEMGKAVLGLATEIMPGGRQAKKFATGLETVGRGGKYKGYGDEARLQYPVENDFWSTVQALMFGNNALSENREFYASGASGLTANQTQLYQSLVDGGVSREDAYDAIQEYRAINNDKSLTSYERGQSQRDMIRGLDMTDEQKLELYRGMTNADSRAEQFQMLMDAGMDWDQVMDAYDKYAELSADEDLKATERATELAKWVDQQGYTAEQREAVKEQLRYWQNIPAEASSYEKFAGAGLDPDTAYDIQDTLRDLEPEDGKQSVSNGQKIMAIAEMPYGDDVKETALEQVMTEKQYAGYQEALDAGISTYYYCTFITEAAGLEADKDANGKTISGSKKEKVMEAIDELPLTKDQKDILYYQQGYAKSEIGKAPWR